LEVNGSTIDGGSGHVLRWTPVVWAP
jgi:hypothetical protein